MHQNLKAVYIQNDMQAEVNILSVLEHMQFDVYCTSSFTQAKKLLNNDKFQLIFLSTLSPDVTDEKLGQIKKSGQLSPLLIGVSRRNGHQLLEEKQLDAVINPLQKESLLRKSLKNILQSYKILEDPHFLESQNLIHKNIFDSKYFNFFYKIHYKRGLKHLLFVLKEFRNCIIDMNRLSRIYQEEPGIYEFFRENCQQLIPYAQKSGAHKIRKMLSINLSLMEKNDSKRLILVQKNFQNALEETEYELKKLIANVEP